MRKLLGPSGYNRVMTKQTVPSADFFKILSVSRLGALATSVALAFGAITATAGTAQAAGKSGACTGPYKNVTVKVDCKTGKPLSQQNANKKQARYENVQKRANGGFLPIWISKADNGVFNVPLPAHLRGKPVTVKVDFGTRVAPDWLIHRIQEESIVETVTMSVRKADDDITVAIPSGGSYFACWSLKVAVEGATGPAVKINFVGKWSDFTGKDNGYTGITVLP